MPSGSQKQESCRFEAEGDKGHLYTLLRHDTFTQLMRPSERTYTSLFESDFTACGAKVSVPADTAGVCGDAVRAEWGECSDSLLTGVALINLELGSACLGVSTLSLDQVAPVGDLATRYSSNIDAGATVTSVTGSFREGGTPAVSYSGEMLGDSRAVVPPTSDYGVLDTAGIFCAAVAALFGFARRPPGGRAVADHSVRELERRADHHVRHRRER